MIASLTLVVLFPAAHDCNVSTPLESGDENHGKGAVRVAMACPELKGSSRTKARPLGTARQDARPGSCAVLPHDHSPM